MAKVVWTEEALDDLEAIKMYHDRNLSERMTIEAKRGDDGQYRVPFARAWRLTTISRVIAEGTNEPLVATDRTLSRLGSWYGIAMAVAVNVTGFIWVWVLDTRHTAIVLLVLVTVIAIIGTSLTYMVSRKATFARRT